MEVVVILVIIFSVVNAISKQAKQRPKRQPPNAPAKAEPPANMQTVANQKMEDSSRADDETSWQQVSMSELLGQAKAQPESVSAKMQDGHGVVKNLSEGDSRACEHGSLGGSIAYDSHEGGRVAPQEIKRLGRFVATEAVDALYEPSMDVRQMRQAVVMAEILKRPAERQAEQARRWGRR